VSPGPTDIGSTLREARMRARIDISEVESATKIRARYLRAIENEEWELLPGPTYVKSFLRTYAEHLGLDAKLLVEEYKLRHESIVVEHESRPIGSALSDARRSRQSRQPRVPRGVMLAAGGVAVVALLIVIGSIGGSPDPTSPPPVVDRTTKTTTRGTRPSGTPSPARKVTPALARLSIVPQGDVYTCVRDASDGLVLSETLTPGGGKKTFKGKHFRVTVGNSAVLLTVNGKRVNVQPSSTETNFEILPGRARKLGQDSNAC
jgi:transcriptional regulator with XRE-family HTH domain